ncbi:MAG: amidohydrolase family protein [bacterium]
MLYKAAIKAGTTGIILLNIPELAFDNRSVLEEAQKYERFFQVFVSVKPGCKNSLKELHNLHMQRATGLKLHPRLDGYLIDSDTTITLVKEAGQLDMPVMIDCFPDGKNLSRGNTPETFARLAEQAPDTRIAIGHAGGHRILDALMVAKYYKNLYLDLSYTLLYYRNSTVTENIAYTIKCSRAQRIFWGSDYPDRPYERTVSLTKKEFERMDLSTTTLQQIETNNVKAFLGWKG